LSGDLIQLHKQTSGYIKIMFTYVYLLAVPIECLVHLFSDILSTVGFSKHFLKILKAIEAGRRSIRRPASTSHTPPPSGSPASLSSGCCLRCLGHVKIPVTDPTHCHAGSRLIASITPSAPPPLKRNKYPRLRNQTRVVIR
jgi:hypothetical protein